ncbi:MAG: pyridoxamine 5'-phosphate oxidase family protein [Pseudomonadota bacterium]
MRADRPDAELAALYDTLWQRLERGVADRRAAARHPVLATQARHGGGEARVVVLRAAARDAGVLTVHTDSASPKVAELRDEPRATLLVWETKARLQVRLRVHVTIRPGSAEEWARVPEASRLSYGGAAPGTCVARPGDVESMADPARFAVLDAHIGEIDLLHLDQPAHRRARFCREDGWRGVWLAP